MAEEFVIRIDTGRGRGPARGTGVDRGSGPGAGGIGLGTAAGQFGAGRSEFQYEERMTKESIATMKQEGTSLLRSKLHNFGTVRAMHWDDGTDEDNITYQQTLFGHGASKALSPFNVSASQAGSALVGGAGAIGMKAVHSNMQHRAYTSGDQYQNQQDSNNMRLAGYGAMLVMSGPKWPLVAAGIAVNEGFNAFNDHRQYNFDRAMDTIQINNTQAVAGDISYGRRNGVR